MRGRAGRAWLSATDPGTKARHLPLEDPTDSYVIATTWSLPPTSEQCERWLLDLDLRRSEVSSPEALPNRTGCV